MLPRLRPPQLREFPNHPTASFIHPSLPHLALNRPDWKTLGAASKTAQGAFLPLGDILSGFFAPARRFLDGISAYPAHLCFAASGTNSLG